MNRLYKVVGISRQAIYKQEKKQAILDKKISELVYQAELIHSDYSGCGVEKIYNTLKSDFIERDRFIALFMELGFRVKMKKNYKRTTYAANVYYPNLIKGMKVNAPSVIWQTDITYIVRP